MTRKLRTYRDLEGEDRSRIGEQVGAQRRRVEERLRGVRHTVAVMSGKGGVGKSFVTAALATALAEAGEQVGVLDADLHAPTAARMLGVSGGPVEVREQGVVPAIGALGVRVMSTDFLLADGAPLTWREPKHEKFVWRGTLEAGVLREFLGDVMWGALDVLLVDLPPGTERFSALAEFVPSLAGVVVVTIPSDASLRAVQRSLGVARDAGIRVLGIVENMAGYVCGQCGALAPLFAGDAAQRLAAAAGAPVLASIPFDPAAQVAADGGLAAPAGAAAAAFVALRAALLARLEAS